jgi:hypothetical protein
VVDMVDMVDLVKNCVIGMRAKGGVNFSGGPSGLPNHCSEKLKEHRK